MANESQVLVLKKCEGRLQVSSIPVDDSEYILSKLGKNIKESVD